MDQFLTAIMIWVTGRGKKHGRKTLQRRQSLEENRWRMFTGNYVPGQNLAGIIAAGGWKMVKHWRLFISLILYLLISIVCYSSLKRHWRQLIRKNTIQGMRIVW